MPLICDEDLELVRADCSQSPAYVAIMEDIFRRERELVKKIETGFAEVILGDGIGLYEGEARDMCTNPMVPLAARERDERDSWKALFVKEFDRNYSSLTFTDAKGFRFLIPAFMLAGLGDEGDDDYALRRLALARDPQDSQFSLLSLSQLESIVEFLRIYYEYPLEIFPKDIIRTALDTCWLPLLHKFDRGSPD